MKNKNVLPRLFKKSSVALITYILLFTFPFCFEVKSQGSTNNTIYHNTSDGLVTDYHNRYNFDATTDFDEDLQQFGRKAYMSCTVIINVDNGTGQIILYFSGSKKILQVTDARYIGDGLVAYRFTCYNDKGGKVPCQINKRNNSIYSFLMQNTANNTAVIFYYSDW